MKYGHMFYGVHWNSCVVCMETLRNVILQFLRCFMREQMFFKTIKKQRPFQLYDFEAPQYRYGNHTRRHVEILK